MRDRARQHRPQERQRETMRDNVRRGTGRNMQLHANDVYLEHPGASTRDILEVVGRIHAVLFLARIEERLAKPRRRRRARLDIEGALWGL